MNSLKQQTVSGIKWQISASIMQKIILVGTTEFLARILNPSIFGIFALSFVFIDGLGLFKSLGFDTALIQKKENIEKAANTAFITMPILGAIFYAILIIIAPLIGKYLNNKEIVSVIQILGLIFVISCFSRVPTALLEKSLNFKAVSMIEVSSATIYSLVSILLAFRNFGIWSLVFGYLIKTITQAILSFTYCRWRPVWEFDIKLAR